MIICKSEPKISFGTQQQPYFFLSHLKNPYCFCLKLKKKPQNTHIQVYENFEFYSKKIEKNDFPCLEIMSILLGKCKIRKSKLYSYRLLSHCALHGNLIIRRYNGVRWFSKWNQQRRHHIQSHFKNFHKFNPFEICENKFSLCSH